MRSEFRDVARLRRDRFLTSDILASMPLQAGRCRAERFLVSVSWFCPEGISLFGSYMTPFPQKPGEHHN